MAAHEASQLFNVHIQAKRYDGALQVLAEAEVSLTSLTTLPIRERAHSLDAHRALCACIRDACDFAVSFEAAFAHREALLRPSGTTPNAAQWVVRTLHFTLFAPANVVAAAMALRRLGSSLQGRSLIGRQRGVAVLLKTWRQYQNNGAVVEALSVLCNGHVDNVSRFVREDGIEQSLKVLESDNAASSLKGEVLLLLGVCCVCLPDEGKGGKLVATVVSTLQKAVQERTHSSRLLAANALSCLANVGEATARDMYMTRDTKHSPLPGYDVPEPLKVMTSILEAWNAWPCMWNIVSPAAWALVAMIRANQLSLDVSNETLSLLTHLSSSCAVQSSSVRALEDMMREAKCSTPIESCAYLSPSKVGEKRRMFETPPCSPVTPLKRALVTTDNDCNILAKKSELEGSSIDANFETPMAGTRKSLRNRMPGKHADGSLVNQ